MNAVVIPEPLGLVARYPVLAEMPVCGHAKLCDDEILKHVERWLEKSEWTLTGVLPNTDGTKGVDVSFGIIFFHDLWK